MLTIKQLEQLKAEGKIRGYVDPKGESATGPKKNKYRAKKTEIDGIVFDSIKEAKRYIDLRYLQTAGEITELKLQEPFELNEGGTHSLKYLADFTYYTKSGEYVVEDAKGFRTKEYKKKKRLMKQIHQIEIREV